MKNILQCFLLLLLISQIYCEKLQQRSIRELRVSSRRSSSSRSTSRSSRSSSSSSTTGGSIDKTKLIIIIVCSVVGFVAFVVILIYIRRRAILQRQKNMEKFKDNNNVHQQMANEINKSQNAINQQFLQYPQGQQLYYGQPQQYQQPQYGQQQPWPNMPNQMAFPHVPQGQPLHTPQL